MQLRKGTIARAVEGQRGFTLTELMAVIAILGILAGLVAGAVAGTRGTATDTRLEADKSSIGRAVDAFFNASLPQTYPVVSMTDTDAALIPVVAGDLGVRLIDLDAALPQDGSRTFVPDFLKEVPASASQVSWRVDTNTGSVFFADAGATLVLPFDGRLRVTAAANTPSIATDYEIELTMNKHEAATDVLEVEIPAGYVLGGQSQVAGTKMGKLEIVFASDNPWVAGETLAVATASVVATGRSNEWDAVVAYDSNTSSGGSADVDVKDAGTTIRTHRIEIASPRADVKGKLTLTMDRTTDPEENEAGETFKLTIFGHPIDAASGAADTGVSIITNPNTPDVYRWLAAAHTSIDLDGTFDIVPGNQTIFIK